MFKLPFIRGAIVLWENLIIGTKALIISANEALPDEDKDTKSQKLGGFSIFISIFIAIVLGFGLFAFRCRPTWLRRTPTPSSSTSTTSFRWSAVVLPLVPVKKTYSVLSIVAQPWSKNGVNDGISRRNEIWVKWQTATFSFPHSASLASNSVRLS